MHHFPRIAAVLSVLLLLTSAPPLAAQVAQVEEDEYAETPTDLGELLADVPDSDAPSLSYLRHETPTRDKTLLLSDQVAFEDSTLAVSHAMIVLDASGEVDGVFHRRTRYSSNGELIRRDVRNDGRDQSETRSLIPDDETYLLTRTFASVHAPGVTKTDQESLTPIHESAIPNDWVPIAYAYHLRHGHTSFVVRTQEWGSDSLLVHYVEDIGVETVEVAGVEKAAHVLMVHITLEPLPGSTRDIDGWDGIHLQEYAFLNGATFQTRRESGDMTLEYLPATAEETELLLESLPPLDQPED
ncbi:hypothetical protein OT109_05115 [Phycisphaeraceae bacterium D3-23]